MPIYEYVCEGCGRLTEVMQRISDPPPAACPDCGGARLAKVVSRTSFQLKGGGWYADLYSSSTRNTEGGPAPAAGAKPAGEASPAAGAAPSSAAPAAPAAATPAAPAAPAPSGTGGGGAAKG